jgi:hypothetical protein
MIVRNIGLGVMGLGALLIAFGVLMWFANKPDVAGDMARFERQVRTTTDTERRENRMMVDRTERAYQACLFSSTTQICRYAPATPYLNIGGILVFLAGGGLFVIGRMRRDSDAADYPVAAARDRGRSQGIDHRLGSVETNNARSGKPIANRASKLIWAVPWKWAALLSLAGGFLLPTCLALIWGFNGNSFQFIGVALMVSIIVFVAVTVVVVCVRAIRRTVE